MTDLTVSITKTLSAPIEQVFDAWLDPAMLTRFILPTPGMPQPDVENDPREGGRFRIVMHLGDDRIPHTGTYLEVQRPRRLKFSWESPYSTDDSTVTLDFTALDAKTTRVVLTQMKFLHEEARSDHETGWRNVIDQLAVILAPAH